MNPFWKDILREIGKTKGRFVSMMMITMLGAMLVVGIRATAINMRYAAHSAYAAADLFDLQLRSPIGFTPEQAEQIAVLPGVYRAMPTYIFDAYITVQDTQRVARTYALPMGINEVRLVEGRLPAAEGEIAVERRLLREGRLSLGDTIDLRESAEYAAFTVVGVVESPLYITGDRGNTTLGAGVVRYYVYFYAGGVANAVYTDIFLLMDEARGKHTVSAEYNTAANRWRREIEEELTRLNISAFVFTRQNGVAFESYFQDSLRLDEVGRVFPLIFFLVAILVALTAMSRMVEDGRGQIGIYKALGFSPSAVITKYAVYAAACGLAGGIIGVVLGSQVIPRIIFDAYAHMYNMPYSTHPIPWGIAFVTVGITIVCILGTALITCASALRGGPAALMRPKTPKTGKRVFLEYFPFLWRNISFINKVTARNIFRYKRRFFMSIAGVAGCTALVLTGFGLRDSIGSVAQLQFDEIIMYDLQVHFRRDLTPEEKHMITHNFDMSLFLRTKTADAYTDSGGFPAVVITPLSFNELPYFIRPLLPNQGQGLGFSGDEISETNGVWVTEKLAREMQISAGDYFTISVGGNAVNARASLIIENYVQHFIYMPPCYYARLFNREPAFNSLFVRFNSVANSGNASGFIDFDFVHGITNAAFMRDNLSQQTDALGVVTVVILIMACILAFVVLYNLTEINIIERARELATIKVLGFFDHETAMYIYRENMIVTLIGIAAGLFGGIRLNSFVLSTVEIDMLKFPHIITPLSFLMAAGLSVVFALMVNVVTYKRLTNVDMVSALKSVE